MSIRPLLLPTLLLAACEPGDPKDSAPPDDSGDSGGVDSADSGDSADTADSADSGDTADTGETGDTGETADTDCLASTWYPDVDRDDYGDDAGAEYACEPTVTNPVLTGGDCDDANPDVHPGLEEVCGDGLDNDCDGSGCGIFGDLDAYDADVIITGHMPTSDFGTSIITLDDATGDGLPDLAVGAPQGGKSAVDLTSVWVMEELVTGTVEKTGVKLTGASWADEFGTALADAGDLNGDGLSDLWVSAPYAETETAGSWAVYLFLTPFDGQDTSTAYTSWWGESYHHGGAFMASGDLDGDGVVDLAVGNTQEDSGNRGEVWVLPGADVTEGELDDLGHQITRGSITTSHLGRVAVADVDGDGQDDLYVGAASSSPTWGRTWLFRGPILGDLDLDDADATFVGEAEGDATGATVFAFDDFDGDGLSDLGAGSPNGPASSRYEGHLYVHSGAATGEIPLADAFAYLLGKSREGLFSTSATSGDFNGNGSADLAVGAPDVIDGSAHEGKVWVFHDLRAGSYSELDADGWVAGPVGSNLGIGVHAEDLDADGLDELAIGGDRADHSGAVYLFWGRSL